MHDIIAAGIIIAMALVFASTQISLSIRFLKQPPEHKQQNIQVLWAWDRLYVFFWDSGKVLMSRDMGDSWTEIAHLDPTRYY